MTFEEFLIMVIVLILIGLLIAPCVSEMLMGYFNSLPKINNKADKNINEIEIIKTRIIK